MRFLTEILAKAGITSNYFKLDVATAPAIEVGKIVWNSADGTFDMGLLNDVTLQAGQELHFYGKAVGAISNGQAVMFAGAQGDHALMTLADAATINANPEYFIGVATQDFANNDFGYVTVLGKVRGLNTSAYTAGDLLYYNSTSATDGLLTSTMPSAPNAKIIVAAVLRSHANQGVLLVRPHTMPKISDIQDVSISSLANNDFFVYESATSVWKNKTIAAALGYTPADDASVVKLTGDQTIAGVKTFTSALLANNPSEGATGEGIIAGQSFKIDATGTGQRAIMYVVSKTLSNTYGSGLIAQYANSDGDKAFGFNLNTAGGFELYVKNTAFNRALAIANTMAATFGSSVTATSFIKSGGTSAQFLKADGSVDGATYLTSITSSNVTTALGFTPATDSHTHDLMRYSLRAPSNIDGLTTTNFRSTLFGSSSDGWNISAARWNDVPTGLSGMSAYGTMIAWSGSDTQGFIATNYDTGTIQVGGGNANLINWRVTLLHSSNFGSYALPLSGGSLTGKVTFPSTLANRPQFPGGILGLDTGDGNFDIWGISRDYYPSNPTAAEAWGIRWNGDNNDIEFVGGGNNRVIIDLDNGNVTATTFIGSATDSTKLPLAGGTLTGNVIASGDTYTTYGPNSTWASYLRVGGNGRTVDGNAYASVVTTNGNLHLDAGNNRLTYINYYAGTGGIVFGNGASGVSASVDASGNIWKGGTPGAGTQYVFNSGTWGINITGSAATATDSTKLPLSGGTLSGNIVYSNTRKGLVGLYNPAQTQAIFAMGIDYVLADGGASSNIGDFYGLGWSYNPDYAGAGNNPQSKAGLDHQLLLMNAGVTLTALGRGIWTVGSVTAAGATFSGAVTTGLLIAQGPGGNYNENIRLPGSTAVISFNTSGTSGVGSYNIVSQTNFQIRNGSGTQVFVMDQSGNLTMTGTVTAPTFSGALSGNATSATTATLLNSSNYINQRGSTGSWNTDFSSTPAGSANYGGDVGANSVNGPGGSWWIQQNFRHTNGGDLWGVQVAWGWEDNPNRLATRSISGGNFGSWVYYLNSSNFTSYVNAPNAVGNGNGYYNTGSWMQMNGNFGIFWPGYYGLHLYPNNEGSYGSLGVLGEKNGWRGIHFGGSTGMTLMMNETEFGFHRQGIGWYARFTNGTGDFNIVGSAGAVAWGNVTSKPSDIFFYEGFTLNADTMSTNASGFTYAVGAPHTGPIMRVGNGGYSLQLNAAYSGGGTGISFRTRNGDAGTFNPWRNLLNDANYTTWVGGLTTGNNWTGQNYFVSNRNTTADSAPLQAYSNNGSGAIMSFHRAGAYAVNFGLDSDNVMRIGGWSASPNRWQLDMSGNETLAGSSTATSFFESSDSRLKTLIDESGQVLGIENLEAKLYEKNGKIEFGYFAQDAQKLMPYAVTENSEGFLNLSYREVHTAKIARLEKELEELKAKLN
jgi:hypothetical protein